MSSSAVTQWRMHRINLRFPLSLAWNEKPPVANDFFPGGGEWGGETGYRTIRISILSQLRLLLL